MAIVFNMTVVVPECPDEIMNLDMYRWLINIHQDIYFLVMFKDTPTYNVIKGSKIAAHRMYIVIAHTIILLRLCQYAVTLIPDVIHPNNELYKNVYKQLNAPWGTFFVKKFVLVLFIEVCRRYLFLFYEPLTYVALIWNNLFYSFQITYTGLQVGY